MHKYKRRKEEEHAFLPAIILLLIVLMTLIHEPEKRKGKLTEKIRILHKPNKGDVFPILYRLNRAYTYSLPQHKFVRIRATGRLRSRLAGFYCYHSPALRLTGTRLVIS